MRELTMMMLVVLVVAATAEVTVAPIRTVEEEEEASPTGEYKMFGYPAASCNGKAMWFRADVCVEGTLNSVRH